jgi:hypothetical protein
MHALSLQPAVISREGQEPTCGWRIPNHAAIGARDQSIAARHTGMVAEFCAWRPVNTKSTVRDSGRSSLTGADQEVRSRPSRGAIYFLRLTSTVVRHRCPSRSEHKTDSHWVGGSSPGGPTTSQINGLTGPSSPPESGRFQAATQATAPS